MTDQPSEPPTSDASAAGDQPPASDSSVLPATRPAGVTPAPVSRSGAVSVNNRGVESVIIAQDAMIDVARLRGLSDPFASISAPRMPAREVIRPGAPADEAMLRRFVTPQRLNDLWSQLEALQEEVVQQVRATRIGTDAYQQDLLFATTILLESPSNYEEARQIVYRVRADLQRERRVLADIKRFRPRILAYYVAVCLITFLAIGLDPAFRAAMPASLPILKMGLLPILFGVFGASFNGLMALHEHTTVRRDFDPIHASWYFLNPFIGGLMGLVVFIFFVVTGSTFTPNLATNQEMADAQAPLVIWLLAFIVGWQQNILFNLLNRFLKTFLGDSTPRQEGRPLPLTDLQTGERSRESGGGSQVAPGA